jgi:putative colanic acid biosynthesis acetyltransferase WcaF
MSTLRRKSHVLTGRYQSAWSVRELMQLRLWNLVWLCVFRPSPKLFNGWRLFLLRCFGATVRGRPFIYSSAKVFAPFHLTIEDRVCLGPHSEVYNLGPVHLECGVTLSHQSMVCNGTHDFDDPTMPLLIGDTVIGEDAFIGARAFIMPGVSIGARAIVGACAVVTKDVKPGDVVAGNPAKTIRSRRF